MRQWARTALVTACASTLLLVAGCDKDKNVEPPAELIDLKPTLEVRKLWSAKVGGDGETLRLALGLALDGDTLYAASRDGGVEAFDPATGRTKWKHDAKADLSAGPGVLGNVVAVVTIAGAVVSLDKTGKPLWKVKVNGEVLAAPLVTATRVVVRTVDGRVRTLDAADGKELWSAEEPVPRLSLRGTSPPVLAGESVLAGFDSGKVVAYALGTGDVAWQAQVTTPHGRSELERLADVDSAVHIEGDDGYAVGYQGRAVMFALDTGQVWWSRDLSSYRGLALDADQLYVSTSEGYVTALRRRDGTQLWQQEGLARRGLGAPAVVGNAVVVGDFEGYLHWLDRDSGKFVARERPGKSRISAAPIVVEGRVYAIDDGGRIVAYRVGDKPGT